MTTNGAPILDGIHHVKLPVADLDRTQAWYASRLGYRPAMRFTRDGRATGLVLKHPNGGPMIGFVRAPDRAARSSGFDYFSIGVPDKAAIERLAALLTALGETHAGVHIAPNGWILPETHDPDGHEVRFYTTDHHTGLTDEVIVVEDPVGTEAQREQAYRAESSGS